MKRFFILMISICVVGIVFATDEDYPPITPNNVMNLQEVTSLGRGHANPAVTWSPDSSTIIVGGYRGIFIYESPSAEPQFIELGLNIQYVLFASENLAFLSDATTLIAYDLATKAIQYQREGMRPLGISRDEQLLAFEVDMGVTVLDIATNETRYEISYAGILEPESDDNKNSFVFVQFYPDDSGLVLRWAQEFSSDDGARHQRGQSDSWNFSDLSQPLPPLDWRYYEGEFFALDHNGAFFGLGEYSLVWANDSLSLNFDVPEHIRFNDLWLNIAVQANRVAIPSMYYDENRKLHNFSNILNLVTGERIARIEANGRPVFSPDGRYIALDLDVYEIATGEFVASLESEWVQFLDIPDRILYRDTDDTVQLLDTNTFEAVATLPMTRHVFSNFRVDEDNLLLFSETLGLGIRLNGITGAELVRYQTALPYLMSVWSVIISPDKRYLLQRGSYANSDIAPRLWDYDTGAIIPLPQEYELISPYFLGNGQLFAWDSYCEEVVFYDIDSSTVTQVFPAEHSEYGDDKNRPPNILFVSPDEQYILIGNNGFAKLWSLEIGQILWQNDQEFENLRFSPDGRYLVYFTNDLYHLMVVDIVSQEQFSISQFDTIGTVEFVSGEVLHAWDSFQDTYYNLGTREFVDAATVIASPQEPAIQANGLNFYYEYAEFSTEWKSLRIETTDGHFLHRLNFNQGYYLPRLSSDSSRLFLNYRDGTISIWAVPN
jgi:WD40 repeat protein